MPTIAIFYGMVIQMYWRDHPPPHIHVLYQGFEAVVAIETGIVIGGRLPPNAARIVRERVLLRRPELMQNWERGRSRKSFLRVPGPDEDI
jgi:Domain of unknown function (DUF4160)